MSYALRRGTGWISAPNGLGDGQVIPPVLALCNDAATAWLSATIDEALERATLLRMCWGWTTEVRAIR